MRTFELSTPMPAPAATVWRTLLDLDQWPRWNKLVPFAAGDVQPGEILAFKIRSPDGGHRDHGPTVLSMETDRQIVLSASFGHRRLLTLVHTFTIDEVTPESCRLHQGWVATGWLVPVLWTSLRQTMARFSELGEDLAARVAPYDRDSVPDRPVDAPRLDRS